MCHARSRLLPLVILCRFGTIALAADSVAPPQLQTAVGRLAAALPGWSVHQTDLEPSVAVDGRRGYRVVMRSAWKELAPGAVPQQRVGAASRGEDDATYVTKHSDWHFVLFPASDARLPAGAKREILWHVPDEKQFRLPVALGEGHGFVWFTFASIPMQHFLRERLMLTGGDDRLKLALRGLSVVDEGMNTRNSVLPLFAQFGDQGFEALDEEIRTSVDPSNAIYGLAYFRDAKATGRLVELYQSPNEQIRHAAAYSLVHQPYRPAAKEAYLDMIVRQWHANEAIQACLEFGWKEALPLIAGVVEKPSSLSAYREAYKAYRQLSGNPIDADLLAAATVIHRQSGSDPESQPAEAELAAARRTIVASADTEGAAFIALSLATFVTKGNTAPINRDGVEVLRALPRPVVAKMLNRLSGSLREADRAAVLEVLREATS